MENKKQTSLEWLIEQCPRINTIASLELIEKAKEMHKQEIVKAFEVGYGNGACVNDDEPIYHGSNYYYKKYGGNNES